MPEGHTIHRLARDQLHALGGQKLRVSSPQGRFDASLVDGRKLTDIEAYGKHLVYVFAGRPRRYVHVHLGLFGKYRTHADADLVRPSVRMRLSGEVTIDLAGPTACEVLDRPAVDLLYARLGVDPLRDDADLDAGADALHRRRTPLGALLLDQSVISGIGNVYRAEILFLHRLHPSVLGSEVSKKKLRALLDTTRRLLQIGVETNRILTVEGATAKMRRDQALYVYKQGKCKRCKAKIETTTSGGRTLYFCPRCQLPPG